MKRNPYGRRTEQSPIAREVAEFKCEKISNLDEIKQYLSLHLDMTHQRKHLHVMCALAEALSVAPGAVTFECKRRKGGRADWEVTVYYSLAKSQTAIAHFVMKQTGKSDRARFGQFQIVRHGVEKALRFRGLGNSEAKRMFDEIHAWSRRYSAIRCQDQQKGSHKGISLELNACARKYLYIQLVEKLAQTLVL